MLTFVAIKGGLLNDPTNLDPPGTIQQIQNPGYNFTNPNSKW